MHVLGLLRTSGFNIPAAAAADGGSGADDGGDGSKKPPANTRIGRFQIVSKRVLRENFGGGASLALEPRVCSFSPSFLEPAGGEASVLRVLRPPEGEAAAKQPGGARKPGGVVVVSPRGGGGATTSAAAAAAAAATERTLSAGETAVVRPGDTLYFPGCPRELVGLRILAGAAKKDAQELYREEHEAAMQKKRKAEEELAAGAAAPATAGNSEGGRARRPATAAATAPSPVPAPALLPTPEPFHRWHFSFFNTKFSGRVERRLREYGASVSTLVPSASAVLAAKPGSVQEDAYLSLFPPPPSSGGGEGGEEEAAAAAAAERVAAEVREHSRGKGFFAAAQAKLREAGLPPPLSAGRGGQPTPPRASAVIIGGEVEEKPAAAKGGGGGGGGGAASSSSSSRSFSAPAVADDGEFAEVCEIRALRLAGLWPPPPGGWWAKRNNPSSSPSSPSSSASAAAAAAAAAPPPPWTSEAAALIPRSDFPIIALPRTFVMECLASPPPAGGGGGGMPRVDLSRLPLIAARFAAVGAAREVCSLEELVARVRDRVVPKCYRALAEAEQGGGGGGGAAREKRLAELRGMADFAHRKLVLAQRAVGLARQLQRDMEAWWAAEERSRGLGGGVRRSRASAPAAAAAAQPQQQQQQQLPRAPAARAAPAGAAAAAPAATSTAAPAAASTNPASSSSSSSSSLLLPRFGGPLPPPEASTGGASGRLWGLRGVWLEPFSSLAGACKVYERIQDSYRGLSKAWRSANAAAAAAVSSAATAAGGGGGGGGAGTSRAAAAAAAAAAASDDYDYDEGFRSDDDDDAFGLGPARAKQRPSSSPSSSNGACTHHAAYRGRASCLVDPLKEARANYDLATSTAVPFKKNALDSSIKAVEACDFPLRTKQDFDKFTATFKLGPRSLEKVWEVVETGGLKRNAVLAADPRNAALRELMRVGSRVFFRAQRCT